MSSSPTDLWLFRHNSSFYTLPESRSTPVDTPLTQSPITSKSSSSATLLDSPTSPISYKCGHCSQCPLIFEDEKLKHPHPYRSTTKDEPALNKSQYSSNWYPTSSPSPTRDRESGNMQAELLPHLALEQGMNKKKAEAEDDIRGMNVWMDRPGLGMRRGIRYHVIKKMQEIPGLLEDRIKQKVEAEKIRSGKLKKRVSYGLDKVTYHLGWR